jgi:N-acyl-D-aspartate/D-glutamate deacylase
MRTICRVAIRIACTACMFFFCVQAITQPTAVYDIVLSGGRVIDPETKLDAIRNIGISQNRIAEISTGPLRGRETINVSGMIVSPGFIDLHVHGRSNQEQEYQVHDGVTTALELEWGVEYLKEWYDARTGKAMINFGASVNWPFERYRAMEKYKAVRDSLYPKALNGSSKLAELFATIGHTYTADLQQGEMEQMLDNIRSTLHDGAVGIGVPIGYLPKTNPAEMYQVYRLAAVMGALVFSHVREPNIISIQEAMNDAMLTGASLHVVHVNSMSLSKIRFALDMVKAAQGRGYDITTELYPYTAGSTQLQSAMFNEGWQERMGISYGDLQWVATGERLTKETYEAYRKSGGTVILHVMKPEWISEGIREPSVMIASDGMPYAPLAHPRTAGTFSRVLGKYVREDKIIDLPMAIEKMTLLPAKRLETIAPSMRFKGRIQVGADADITVFNPNTVVDKASFDKGLAFSEGIAYVIEDGVFVIRNGKTVSGVFPGQPVYGKFRK